MTVRSFSGLALALFLIFLAAGCGRMESRPNPPPQYTPALAEGMARIRVSRSEETLLLPHQASVILNGRPWVTLGSGDRHAIDVPAGHHVIAVSHRAGAAASVAHVEARAGQSYRLLVTLDPGRFPAYDGPERPFKFIRESLDAPHDDRRPLFLVRPLGPSERVPVRSSARRSEAELDRELERAATGPMPVR